MTSQSYETITFTSQDIRHQLDSHSTRLSQVVTRETRPRQSESTIQQVMLSDTLANLDLADHLRPDPLLAFESRMDLPSFNRGLGDSRACPRSVDISCTMLPTTPLRCV